jgi:hypothetical protein
MEPPARHDPNWQPSVMAAEDLFFRDDDRARMDQAVRVLSEDKQSVTLACDNDEVLAHYGRVLVRRLRQTPQMKVEVYYPSNTEALLQRFNDALAPISVEQARRVDGPSVPASVWVLHDAKLARSDELQLLLRLVHDFPGANVRLVLLLGGAAATQPETGRRMLRWSVKPPTDTEAEAMRHVGRLMGFEADVQALLERLGAPDVQALSPAQEAVGALTEVTDPAPDLPEAPPKATRAGTRLVWLTLALLVLAVALVLAWYPQQREQAIDWLDAQWQSVAAPSPADSAPAAVPTVAPAPTSSAASVEATTPAAAIDTPTTAVAVQQPLAAAPLSALTPVMPAPAAPESAPPATAPQVTPAEPAATEAAVAADSKGKEPVPAQPEWDAGLAAARDWVRRMPRGVWLVQHASLDDAAAAKAWLQQHPQLRRARVVAARKPSGQRHYVVVSGPFNGFDRAKAYAAQRGMPSQPWLRGAASLKTVLANETD